MAMRCAVHHSTKASAVSLGPLSTRTRAGRPYNGTQSSRMRDHAGARNRRPDLNRESLPITFVEDVEGPEAPAVVEGIGHEIEGPGLVEARRRDEGLAEPRGHAPARAPRQSEPQGAGHAMDALMVP